MRDLTLSNPTRAGISYPAAEVLAALSDSRALTYEPTAEGLAEAREAIAAASNTVPERVLLTASTSEAYSYLFKLLCDPGDEVLVPRPSYPLFEHLAHLESVNVRQYPLAYQEGWWIDIEALRALVSPRTRALVIVNPNNPTGSFLKRHELEALVSLGLPIISDEVFRDYRLLDDPSAVHTLASESRVPVFCLGGLSKSAGLPQLKLGWIIHDGTPAIAGRLALIADTYLSVGASVQHAAARLLALRAGFQAQVLERLRANLSLAPDALRVEGGWTAILRLARTMSEEDWTLRLLADHNVLVQPGYFYDFDTEAFAVVSLLTPTETFEKGIQRIRAAQSDC